MIAAEELNRRLFQAFPDAEVVVTDLTGGEDHYQVKIVSQAFRGLLPLQRHRLVYQQFADVLGGALHALSLTTLTPEEK